MGERLSGFPLIASVLLVLWLAVTICMGQNPPPPAPTPAAAGKDVPAPPKVDAKGPAVPTTPPAMSRQPEQDFRLGTTVINVPVTVTDAHNRFVKGLDPEHFEIYDDKVQQKIEFFSDIDAPISVGLVFDVSGSMKNRLRNAHGALTRFMESSHADDDFFLVTFNSSARLTRDFTTDANAITNALALVEAKGSTALYDGAYLAIEKVRQGRHKRRAIIIISDGEDNNSRYSYSELRKLIRETDVQIYALSIGDHLGMGVLEQIARTTGGRAFSAVGGGLEDAVIQIAIELRHQYSIGYVTQDQVLDGRWHKLRVVVKPPRGLGKVNVRTRDGYFAQQAVESVEKR